MPHEGTAVAESGGSVGVVPQLTPLNVESVTSPAPGIRRVTAIVTREGVFKGVKRDPTPIEIAAKSAVGKFWLMGHPEPGTEDEWPDMAIGEVIQADFVPGVNKLRVVSDFYEDKLDPEIIKRLDNKEPIENSVGFRATLVHEDGSWNGQRYAARETDLEITHIAIVPAGACGWKDGCGLGLHETDNLDDISDDQLVEFFDHQIGRLADLQDAGCDQTARYHCRYDLAKAIDASERRDTNPLQKGALSPHSEGRDERTQAAIREAQDWYGKFYGKHSSDMESGGMAENKGGDGAGEGSKGDGNGGEGDILDIGSPDQLEAYLNQVTKIDDKNAQGALAIRVLEKVLDNAKSGKGMFAKPKEKTEGKHSAGDDGDGTTQTRSVYLKPIITIEGGHDDEPGDVATVTFEVTESEGEAKGVVEGLVTERNVLSKKAAEAETLIEEVKGKLTESEEAKKLADAKIREGLIERLMALPGMDEEAVKAYDDMDIQTLEKIVVGMERVHGSAGAEEAVTGEHSRQKTNFSVPGSGNTGKSVDKQYAADLKAYNEALGRD